MINFKLETYNEQVELWPKKGCHILAYYDDASVVVYQAYSIAIATFAIENQYFGGDFSLARMSWIKPNFLWMMYRSGWASKQGQEVVLAIRIKRDGFDAILKEAVNSSFRADLHSSEVEWRKAISNSSVRLQWDPDHDPTGVKLERRAIQLGLRGEMLKHYAHEWIIEIEDISKFVKEQQQRAFFPYTDLVIPKETEYIVKSPEMRKNLGLE